jgi:hypothetical protein
MISAPDASGKVTIYGTYSENNINQIDWPPSIDYAVTKLPCLDFEHNWGNSGRYFYALYLVTESGVRYRIQNFNPGCPDTHYKSWVIVRDIPEEVLLSQDIVFEVHVEIDEGWDTPDYGYDFTLVLRGEDLVE